MTRAQTSETSLRPPTLGSAARNAPRPPRSPIGWYIYASVWTVLGTMASAYIGAIAIAPDAVRTTVANLIAPDQANPPLVAAVQTTQKPARPAPSAEAAKSAQTGNDTQARPVDDDAAAGALSPQAGAQGTTNLTTGSIPKPQQADADPINGEDSADRRVRTVKTVVLTRPREPAAPSLSNEGKTANAAQPDDTGGRTPGDARVMPPLPQRVARKAQAPQVPAGVTLINVQPAAAQSTDDDDTPAPRATADTAAGADRRAPAEASPAQRRAAQQPAANAAQPEPAKPAALKPQPAPTPKQPPAITFGAPEITISGPRPGIALSRGPSIESLRVSWSYLKERHAQTLANLEPRYTRQSDPQRGNEYKLVVGPLESRAEAELLCRQLAARSVACSPSNFIGGRLQ